MFANKRRNIILVVAIILTTIMLTTLFSVSGSIIQSIQNATMYQVGTSKHAGFKFLTQEEFALLQTDTQIRNLSYSIIVGNSYNEELREDYTEIRYTTEDSAKTSFCLPKKGRLPEAANEIATCTQVLDDFNLPHELGQKIHLKLTNGKTYCEDDFILCGFWEKPAATMANQIFVSKEFQESFSPVWKNKSDKEENLLFYAGSINPDFNFPTAFNLEAQMGLLKERLGFSDEIHGGINSAYATSKIDPTTAIIVIFLLLLIMSSGYLIIYNIFYISVSADIRYYGLLKTVGTTDRQLKKLIIKQAVILSALSIPLGMAAGYFISIVLLPVITENMFSIPCAIHPNFWIFAASAVFSWITTRISCIKPCKVIKKISPVEAVRFSEYTGENLSAKRKARKVTPFSMAWENLKRNKKKSTVVILSLAISVLMINVTVSITKSFDENKYIQNFAASDYTISDGSMLTRGPMGEYFEGVAESDIEAFSKIDGVTDIGAIYMSESLQLMEGKAFLRMTEIYEAHPNWFVYSMDYKDNLDKIVYENKKINSHIYGVDQYPFEEMEMVAGKLDWNKFKTGKYVIASSAVTGSDDDEKNSFYQIGDTVNLTFQDGSSAEYEVMAIGDIRSAMGPKHSHGIDVYFTLPKDEYLKHVMSNGAMKLCFNVNDDKIENAEAFVKEYCDVIKPNLGYTSRKIYLEDFKGLVNMFLLVGGALSIILALIGILNFVNLTYTSIHERKTELEVLRAVGMTKKQMQNMLVSEGVIHIILTFAFVLTIGLLINHLLVNLIAGQTIMFSYKFVIWPILACIPAFALVSMVIPVCSLGKDR